MQFLDSAIDKFYSKYSTKFARERTKYEENEYWAAASRNIAPVTLEEHKNGKYLIINKKVYGRCIIVGVPTALENGYPEGLGDTLYTKLIELSDHGRQLAYSLKLVPVSSIEARKEIQKSIYMTEVNADRSIENNVKRKGVNLRDMDTVIAQEHNVSNYRDVIANRHKLYKSAFIITMWADTEEDLYATEADIITILESENVKSEIPDYWHKEAYLAAQPYNLPIDFAEVQLLTPYAAVLASSRNPNSRTDTKGVWFGVDKVTNKDIIIDIDKLVAPHLIGLGATGSGKTASTFAYLMRILGTGYRVIYMTPKADTGTNHRALCDFYGDSASLIDIGPQGHNINPLQIIYDRSAMKDNVSEYVHAFNTHKEIMIRFLNVWFEGTGSVNMDNRLDAALSRVYQDAGIVRDMPSTWHNANWPVVRDLIKVFERDLENEKDSEDRKTLKSVLNKTRSMADGGLLDYMNRPTDTDFSKDLIVIDLSGTPPVIQDAMNVLVAGICGQRFRADNQRSTVICVDEAGVFLRNQKLTEFLLRTLTMGRSSKISLWCLTQQPSDLKKADVAEEFFTNMSLKFVLGLNMTGDNVDVVAKQFKLGEYEINHLLSCDVGEGIFIIGNQKIPLRIQMTEKELDIIKGRTGNHLISDNDSDFETSIDSDLKDLILEEGFCLDTWSENFNLAGWRREIVQNAIQSAGQITAWIREDLIGPDGLVMNQSLDHFATVCQIAGYCKQKGAEVKIIHFGDADIVFSIDNITYAIEYVRSGSHTIPELQEKKSRLLKDYDYVFFMCSQRYLQKLQEAVGIDNCVSRGTKLKDLLDGILQ